MNQDFFFSILEMSLLKGVAGRSNPKTTNKALSVRVGGQIAVTAEEDQKGGGRTFTAGFADAPNVAATIRLESSSFGRRRIGETCNCNEPGRPCFHLVTLALELISPSGIRSTAVVEPVVTALENQLREKLGTPPILSVKNLAGTATTWFEQGKSIATNSELHAALGNVRSYYYQFSSGQQILWLPSSPPAEALDVFYLIINLASQAGIPIPAEFLPLIDNRRTAELLRPLERQKQINTWKEVLADLPEEAPAERPQLPTLRLCLTGEGAAVESCAAGTKDFHRAKNNALRDLTHEASRRPALVPDDATQFIINSFGDDTQGLPLRGYTHPAVIRLISRLLSLPPAQRDAALVNAISRPFIIQEAPLQWSATPLITDSAKGNAGDYQINLITPEGHTVQAPLFILRSQPVQIFTSETIHHLDTLPIEPKPWNWPITIAAEVVESPQGINFLTRIGVPLPEKIQRSLHRVPPALTVRCSLKAKTNQSDSLTVSGKASWDSWAAAKFWQGGQEWVAIRAPTPVLPPPGKFLQLESTGMGATAAWLTKLVPNPPPAYDTRRSHETPLRAHKEFPAKFAGWLEECPPGVEVVLDAELNNLRSGKVSGTFNLDLQPSGVDWFDLQLNLTVSDNSLSEAEIQLLLQARGKWVRLKDKGWRKLDFQLTPEQEREIADLGLVSSDFTKKGEKQRLHVLQLAGAKSRTLLPDDQSALLQRRAGEIQTSVTPPLPDAITATLRPYQETGFHFLAYLTTNRFGGILADDMGLGKTLMALTWLAWLHGQSAGPVKTAVKKPTKKAAAAASAASAAVAVRPSLVVCPKSVMDNWRTESARFFPGLTVQTWSRDASGTIGHDGVLPSLLIIHYQQLRQHEALLQNQSWLAVILDEAQYIKNPTSQTTKIACTLRADHRLALSGTPVENRLLDLWSIMSFAQPGALGSRAFFVKNFDAKTDPLARRRLAARVRPFLLRRTKKEVASDLPPRIEEEIICEMDGTQASLYQAELKRARAMLLKANTSSALDGMRFHILSSLLRLRQICCHPQLIGSTVKGQESAKLDALLDLLEPLMEEGYKVLIFSQFVEMLDLIRTQITDRGWPHYLLTGATEDRGALVERFQAHAGQAVFLISLKAGGAGLNLTAASYVVLFDPWWNPAVEAQAIDRTHRIGQTQQVIAYRLLVKDSIEQKIRQLQTQKSALASDVLGEDAGGTLTLDDFKYLLGGGDD